jgi:hypothetical protein
MADDSPSERDVSPSDSTAAAELPDAAATAAAELRDAASTTRIVVGIGDSGPEHYEAALAVAARMLQQRPAVLNLVHGCTPRFSITPTGGAAERHLVRGRQLLEEAELVLSPMVDHDTLITLTACPRPASMRSSRSRTRQPP